MKNKAALIGLALCLSGCESMNHTEKGLLTGGMLGTGLGAVIGGLAGDPAAGAALGAVTGLAAGGIAGSVADEREDRQARNQAVAAAYQAVPLHEIVRMAQQHFSDDVIISYIHSKGAVFNLSVNDMEFLASQGVSQRVIHEMVNRRGVAVQPAVVRETVIVSEPRPPHIHIGYGYGWGRRCR